MVPSRILAPLAFDLLHHPALKRDPGRFHFKRQVAWSIDATTAGNQEAPQEEAHDFLFTRRSVKIRRPRPAAPDFNGVVNDEDEVCCSSDVMMTTTTTTTMGDDDVLHDYDDCRKEGAQQQQKQRQDTTTPNRASLKEYRLLYSGAEVKRSRRTTPEEMRHSIACLASMVSCPIPDDADPESVAAWEENPVHGTMERCMAAQYSDKSTVSALSNVECGWISLEAHLLYTEEVSVGYVPNTIKVQGVHSVGRIQHGKGENKQQHKRFKAGQACIGGAYAFWMIMTMRLSAELESANVLPVYAAPGVSPEARLALAGTKWGRIFAQAYAFSLGCTSGVAPWHLR